MKALSQTIADVLASRGDVVAAYLFGSTARGEAGPGRLGDLSAFVTLIRQRTGIT